MTETSNAEKIQAALDRIYNRLEQADPVEMERLSRAVCNLIEAKKAAEQTGDTTDLSAVLTEYMQHLKNKPHLESE